MSILEILHYPHPTLETKSEEIKAFDPELQKFVKDMHETMEHSGGIGLAANQVGETKRVLTIHIPFVENKYKDQENEADKKWWHDKPFTFINPKIIKNQGKISWQEGCLSFPEIYDFVDRAAEVWVEAQDENGETFEVHADGLFSVCLQHEIDHIDGIVFIKRMSRLKASLIRKKIRRKVELLLD